MPLDELPSPHQVARECARLAWRNSLDDDVRLALEQAGDTITILMHRIGTQAQKLEQAELISDVLKNIHYGPQKGGAS